MDQIRLTGARQHNLKNLTLEIPRNALTVVTGVSGSGKSSLVFDTLYAEGQRRYVESVSTYARQFLDRLPRPELERLEGLSPAVAIRQSSPSRSARSTVGTATELLDYLRLLYARVGASHCARCGVRVEAHRPMQLAEGWIARHAGELTCVLFPRVSRGGKSFAAEASGFVASGYLRIYRDGRTVELEPLPAVRAREGEVLWVVEDRLLASREDSGRLVESVASAFRNGEGRAALAAAGGEPEPYHEGLYCDRCDLKAVDPTPQLFSFNSPAGACARCRGFGNTLEFAEDLIVRDPTLSLDEGALDPWAGTWRWRYDHVWGPRLKSLKVRTRVSYEQLNDREKQLALHGDGDGFGGVVGFLQKLQAKSYKAGNRFLVKRYQRALPCPDCHGTRLRAEASLVRVGGLTLPELSARTVGEIAEFFSSLELSDSQRHTVAQVLEEVRARLDYLSHVGLTYLTLDREARTLSGGETQRIELSNALGARLAETLYVLDEPTVGLHPRDTRRLIQVLQAIRDRGNTVVVVEHDREVMEVADWMLDLGPGAGEAGGHLLYSGGLEGLMATRESVTGGYLAGRLSVRPPRARRATDSGRIRIEGIRVHNLDGLSVEFPLGCLVGVSGVSGSGKSTLIHEVLYPAVAEALGEPTATARHYRKIVGAKKLSGVAMLDQAPIGKSSRSNPATYLKAWDPIRELYAEQPLARERGHKPGAFSFNVAGGRCDKCEGEGQVKVEMFIMADVYLPCDACGGKRFRPEMLEVLYRGKSVADVLDMTVAHALAFFSGTPAITARLHDLTRVGLGYLRMGQPAPTLSGGEAQRLKIARELSLAGTGPTLYLMDEPTTGLHPADVRVLLDVLDRLVERGHTVILIEHHPDVLAHADWIVDLGPEGGSGGGKIVAQGQPEVVARSRASHTAPFLRAALERTPARPAAAPVRAGGPRVGRGA